MKNPYEKLLRKQGLIDKIPKGEGFVDILDAQWVEQRMKDWKRIEPYHRMMFKRRKQKIRVNIAALKAFYFTGLTSENGDGWGMDLGEMLYFYPHESVQGWTQLITNSQYTFDEMRRRPNKPSCYNKNIYIYSCYWYNKAFNYHNSSMPICSFDIDTKIKLQTFIFGETYDPFRAILGYKREPMNSDDPELIARDRLGFFSRFWVDNLVELNYWMNGVKPQERFGIPFVRYIPTYFYSFLPYIHDRVFSPLPAPYIYHHHNRKAPENTHPDMQEESMYRMQRALGWQILMIFSPDNYNHIIAQTNLKSLESDRRDYPIILQRLANCEPGSEEHIDLSYAKEHFEKEIKDKEARIDSPKITLMSRDHQAYREEMRVFLRQIDDPRLQQFIDTISQMTTDIWADSNPGYYDLLI